MIDKFLERIRDATIADIAYNPETARLESGG